MKRTLVLLVVIAFLMAPAISFAQQSASSGLVGQVTDSSQAAIPGATVTVTNVGTNAQRTTITDGEGRFSVPALPPATYQIKVELQGFQTAELQNFVLRQGETARPAITLGVATVTESVTVTGDAPLLQTQNATVGQVINEQQLNLPLNGRSVLSLASLSAGVTPRNFARNTQFGRRNQFITVEGGRDSSTNYTIDGVYVRSLRFNNLSLNPPVDAVQEVSLLRNSFSTEYGQGQAVVSIVTKSGTNQLHGSAYEFYRGDRFDAKNYFAPTKPEYERNAFGGTGGGPIVHNKIFVFGAYEGLRTMQGQPFLGSVPSQAFLSGDFSALATPVRDPLTGQPFPGNMVPRARFSKFANTLTPTIPSPNTAGANNYTVIRNFVDDANTATVRSDQTLSNNHSLFQRFMYYKGSQLQPAAFTSTDLPQRGRNLAIGHTWVLSPSLVNEFRFGYNYAYHLNAPISPDGRNWTADLGLQNLSAATFPLAYGRPNVAMAGFSGQGEGGNTQGATENIYSVSNATSKTFGGHTLRFGVQAQFRKFEHLTDNSTRGNFTFNGMFSGNSVADYLLGYCSTCAGAFGASGATYHSPTIAPFIDDNWQATANLSLQLGLRWEYLAPWAEQNGVEAAFDAATGKIGYNALPTSMPAPLVPLVHQEEGYFPDGILQKDLNNFGPRVGVAYNLTDRMVLRSGFGVYYDNLNLNELQFTRLIPPYYGQYSLNPPVTAPLQVDALFPDLNNIPQFPAPFSLDPANRTPYTVQWNVNFQRSLGQDYLFEVAYTGSRSRSLSKRYNINQADFGTTPINSRLPFPQFQPAILYSAAIGTADFKGLSLRFEKRYSAGLFFLANYQLSENRDNGSGEVEANDTAFRLDPDADESLSRYHQRHRGAFSFGYELPFGNGRRWLNSGGPVAYVLGEWQVQGIIRAGSGFPYTLSGTNVCTCGSFVPQRVNYAPGREGGGALDNPTVAQWYDKTAYVLPAAGFQGTAGRNTLIGPGSKSVDFSMSKRFPLGASRLEFRWDVFNLFNTTNFGQPDGNISNVTAGIISTADDARSMQFGIRFVF
jgi:Carboxypeptidase regulatory-like domain/TonB-dependent Receptor Plug Domain/TonB dependent receptor